MKMRPVFIILSLSLALMAGCNSLKKESDFSDGLALVTKGGKYGYVNEAGKVVVAVKYDNAGQFSEGLALVKLDQKYGYIDNAGKEVTPMKYDDARGFFDGFATVAIAGKWGFVDKAGNELVPLKYDGIEDFSEGLAKVELAGKWGYVDKTGAEVIPVKYDRVESFLSDGLAAVNIGGQLREDPYKIFKGGKWGYVNKAGKEVIPVKYDRIKPFYEGFAAINVGGELVEDQPNQTAFKGGRWGFVDKTGKEVIPVKYDDVGNFSEGLAWVKADYKCGYIDHAGKLVIPTKYFKAGDFHDRLARVTLNGSDFFIDKAETWVLDPEMYRIWEDILKSSIKQITDYALKLNSTSADSGPFSVEQPYLLMDAQNDKYCDGYVRKYSGNKFNNESASELKTLIVIFKYLDFASPYIERGTQRKVTIRSYGSYLVYYDMTTKKVIGYDNIHGPDLPEETPSESDIFNPASILMEKFESRLGASEQQ